ncbi:MAG: hypothetical protein KDD44_12710, partial [Bdellovibrionales bacterium]|nr:hypothetical protein [Bdellovibrionales bacterium]
AGLYRDFNDPSSLISTLYLDELRELFDSGALAGGILPKVEALLHALSSGVPRAKLLDGRRQHALLSEVFSTGSAGTTVFASCQQEGLPHGTH